MQQIINLWPYSLQYARPRAHTVIDDIIYGFLKIPPILCYVQKISSKFLKDISDCRMEMFAFDQQAIKNQLEIKKHATISYNQTQNNSNKSLVSKFKGWFRRSSKDDNNNNIISNVSSLSNIPIIQTNINNEDSNNSTSQRSQSQFSSIPDMMKKRQTSFIDLIKNTVENILNQQPPELFKKLFQFFHQKLIKQQIKKIKANNNNLNNINMNNLNNKIDLKHYCYFLMTNFICAQLHNKFTIAHDQTGMTNADLQNISQIIRILSSIFQGQDPQLKRYKSIAHTLNQYRQQVSQFYNNILSTQNNTIHNQSNNNQQIRQTLIQYYQKNILLSFNDVKILIDIYHEVKQKQSKQIDPKLFFLSNPQISLIFDPSKKIKFQNILYLSQNLIFMQDWYDKNSKQLVDYFIISEQPLEYLPVLKDIFFFSSNLTVQQSLQVIQDLKLVKKMPLKQIKQYLIKTANKFRHLTIKDFHLVQNAFKDSLKKCLRNSLKRKQYLLYYRSQIMYKLSEQLALINYYINYLRSQQFYQNISQSFLHNIKIKAYVNIENNLLKVSKDTKQLKGLGISNLMLANNDALSSKSNEDYILRNSFKSFQSVKQLLRCIGKNQITKSAFMTGRKVEQFNSMFCKIVQIVQSYVDEFLKQRVILQSLLKPKLQSLIMKKLQNMIYVRYSSNDKLLEDDRKLAKMCHLIDKQKFFNTQIANLKIQTEFLLQEGKEKFKLLIEQSNIDDKIKQLDELFKVIVMIVGFTMSANKVSTDTLAPVLQYILLECSDIGHFRCLYAMECLNFNKVPEMAFYITTYRSALIYIKENMVEDFPKEGYEKEIKQFNQQEERRKNIVKNK